MSIYCTFIEFFYKHLANFKLGTKLTVINSAEELSNLLPEDNEKKCRKKLDSFIQKKNF